MLLKRVLLCIFLGALTAAAQTGPSGKKSASEPAGTAKPADTGKTIQRPKSYDLGAMDKSVDPCEDFYQYSCGTWRKNNPIPSDQSRWGRFNELADYNRQFLHTILEKDSANNPKRTPVQQKIGDMYASCMDVSKINQLGKEPLKPEMDRIAAITNKEQLMTTIAHLHGIGVQALFGFGSNADLHNASTEIANVIQGGLGLPDRDYYFDKDEKATETRQKYLEHVGKMFVLLGDDEATAKKEAQTVMDIETKLADAAYKRVMMRDPKNRDHKMKVTELETLAPNFHFKSFFVASGAPEFTEVNVVPPDFFQKVDGTIDSVSVDDWKTYLRWHVARSAAPALSDPFVDENFDFYGRYLNGQKEIQPRWKRCVQTTDGLLGEALGQPYVDETFGPDGKARMLKMVQALEAALGQDIEGLDWMTPETKKQAIVKLHAITNKIGYPDKWRDYGTVKVVRGDFLGDTQRARAFEIKRNLNKIGKPLDKKEWGMTPPTVNAEYDPQHNDINFPAGVLQPPLFSAKSDAAPNYGNTGGTIGHELTHGFDDEGRQFDAQGNLRDWWTAADGKEFEERASCISDQYSQYVIVDDVKINGKLTLGEDVADLGGLMLAYMAWKEDTKSQKLDPIDGLTPDQRFFVGYAQSWCGDTRDAEKRLRATTDPHSPEKYRTNGVVTNMPEFQQAFQCKTGTPMAPAKRCRVW